VPPEPPNRPDDQFRALYEAELAYVMRSLRRLGVPERELQDLAHDVFVVVYRRWAEFDRSRAARPWLFGIAMRTASRALERRWRQAEVPVGTETMEALPAVGTDAVETRELLLRALVSIPVDLRAVCILHDLDGLSAPDIAAALEIPVNTVYSRLRVARERLLAAVRALETGKGEAR
jgi:RNA polymerase sigma-70 factor (ECF subfamily)